MVQKKHILGVFPNNLKHYEADYGGQIHFLNLNCTIELLARLLFLPYILLKYPTSVKTLFPSHPLYNLRTLHILQKPHVHVKRSPMEALLWIGL
jgi:hypothetical protein